MDFLEELGELALATRLKRLSERLAQDVSAVYKNVDINFESKWFLVLTLLKKEKLLSVVEISELLKLSHPAIVQFVDEMLKQGLIVTSKDKNDARKRMIALSEQGKKVLNDLEPVLAVIKNENKLWLHEGSYNLLILIAELEQSLDKKSMFDRITSSLQANQ